MIYTILFVLTLILSAFFSGSETAFVSANRLKLLISQHDDRGRPFSSPLKTEERILTSTLVGNNIMMVACSSLAVVVFSSFISSTALVFFTTSFLLLFGEILPKSIAVKIPNRLSSFSLHLLGFFAIIFYPLIWITEKLARQIVQIFGNQKEYTFPFAKNELPLLVREYAAGENFDSHDQLLLDRSLRFLEKHIWDVMVPRTDIVGVDINASRQHIFQTFKESGFSRLPVYRKNLDHIAGFYYILDFFHNGKDLAGIMRPALVLPESMQALEALRTFQRNKVSIAVVVDEHGGTAGLVTIEDIVEMLVGAIDDEFDHNRRRIHRVGNTAIVADGRTTIDELREHFYLPLPQGEYVTVAGLIQEKLGRIAKPGENVDFPHCKIKVLESTPTRISKVWIVKKPKIPKRKQHNNKENRK